MFHAILILFLTASFGGSLFAAQSEKITIERHSRHVTPGGGSKPFDVTRHLIPIAEIVSGGPPRDGIPALTAPVFTSAGEAGPTLRDSDVVIGVESRGVAKAYPVRILNWHEIVNDEIGGEPVAVTW